MKISVTLLVFSLTLQVVHAQFNYVSPVPGSQYHNPQTNIILKNGHPIAKASVADKNLLTIVGSISGNHTWTAHLSDDNKTVVIHPKTGFACGETVFVTINNKLRKIGGGHINGTSFSFKIRDEITPEAQERFKQSRLDNFIESFGYDPTDTRDNDFFETPDSFPTFVINVNNNPSPGRIFYGSQQELDESDTNCFPTIIENDGTLFWARDEGKDGHDFKINHSGYLSYYQYSGSWWKILDSNFNEIDSMQCGNGYEEETNGHEFQMYDDGHAFVIAYNEVIMDMTAYGGFEDASVKGFIIQELDANKDVIFQWRSWDHVLITDANQWTPLTNANVDYIHGNSVERDNDGNLLVSFRNFDEVAKISRETGEIMWRMGGENNQFTFVNDNIPDHFRQQHDARRIANGNITLFNNGNKLPVQISSAKEYHLDEENKVATLIWYYEHPDVNGNHVFARGSGNAQRLPNGNTMINWGNIFFDLELPSMTEVDYDKNIVWEMTFDEEGQKSYRVFKFDFIRCPVPVDTSFTVLFIEPDSVFLEWEDANNSSAYLFQYKLDTAVNWISIPVVTNSISLNNLIPNAVYNWRVQSICEYYSDTSVISASYQFNTIASQVSFAGGGNSLFTLYPNPASSQVAFQLLLPEHKSFTLTLRNMLGEVVHEQKLDGPAGKSQHIIDVRQFPGGVYIAQVESVDFMSRQQLVIY